MNPQQPDFSFINQNGNQKKSLISGLQTKSQRLMLVGLIAISIIVLIIAGTIAFNLFRTDYKAKLTDLASYQTELVRIMDLGVEGSNSSDIRNISKTASLVISTQTQKTLSIATNKNIEINSKELARGITSDSDKLLEAAKNNNTYDETFKKIYSEKLTEYQDKLKSLSSDETDKLIKSALVEYIDSLSLLSLDYKPTTAK